MKLSRCTRNITFHLAALAILFIAATPGSAQTSPPKTAPTPVPKTVANNSIPEAPEVDGWERDDKFVYSPASLGFSYNYNSTEAGRITLYVYDGGRKAIPNELTGLVNDEFQKAKSDIKAAADAGYYQNVKMDKDETVTLGGSAGKVKSLHVFMTFSSNGTKLDSEIYLFAYKNHFVKIRATRPSANKEDAKPLLTAILSSIDSSFASN